MINTMALDIIWLILLVLFSIKFGYGIYIGRKTLHWPCVEGMLHQFDLMHDELRVWPQVLYYYIVNGQEYHGNRISSEHTYRRATSSDSRKLLRNLYVAYKEGIMIDVYYDALNPSSSVLVTGVPRKLYVVTGILIMFVVMHLGFMIFKYFIA